MSFKVYVGNYPSDFTEEDIRAIFVDFTGMKLLRFFLKPPKCYSFFSCKDMDQVVSVVREKNNSMVSGRKLIVRASDDNLQYYVNLLLQEDNLGKSHSSENVSSGATQFMKSKSPRQKKEYNEIWDEPRGKACNQFYSDTDACDSSEIAQCSEKSFSSLERPATRNSYNEDYQVGAWVSVTNFPIGTRVRDLYTLFIDYNPITVNMICNYARRDRILTEAHVAFSDQKIASDVILTFDNTIYNGRLLLVNDIEDLTIMNELLGVSHHNNK